MKNDLQALMTDYLDDFVFYVVRNDDLFQEKLSMVLVDAFSENQGKPLTPLKSKRFVENKTDITNYLHKMFTRYCREVKADNNWGI